MSRSVWMAIFSAVLASVAFPALGQDRDLQSAPQAEATDERRVALVIGNGAYTTTTALQNPVRDAQLMSQALRDVGFEVMEQHNLTQTDMIAAIRVFGSSLRPGDVGLFYYSGHGVQYDGRNWLVPVNANVQIEAEIEFETVDARRVLTEMEASGTRMNIVILDACRNNPFRGFTRDGGGGLGIMRAPTGTIIAFSTAPETPARDGDGQNSPYTAALVQQMKTAGQTLSQTFINTRVAVLEATENHQQPWENSSLTGEFYFKSPAPSGLEGVPAWIGMDADAAALWKDCQGKPEACWEAAHRFRDGESRPHPDAVAVFQAGCEQQEAWACYNLGWMFDHATGVDQDTALAATLYEKACEGGDLYGCSNLGWMVENGSGVAKDATRAITLYEKACEGGNMNGCFNLGVTYDNGTAVEQDTALAATLYQAACEGGEMDGCHNLGWMVENGSGVAKDAARAVALYQMACEGGEMESCFNLGWMVENGSGTAQNTARATELYQMACREGVRDACYALGKHP